MGYHKIPNLYKEREILDLFKEVFALEKIHGTSAHVKIYKDDAFPKGKVVFFSGGEKYNNFIKLFDEKQLLEEGLKFGEHSLLEGITFYGEAYGGRQQGMSATYGQELKFVVFEVKIGDLWLDVPKAEKVATDMKFEFVDFARGPATLEFINAQRDRDSTQAIRNGVGPGKMREGVVLRPMIELTKNCGSRVMVKHKRDDFRETKTPRVVTDEELKILTGSEEIAEEWVVEHRMDHVLGKLEAEGVNTHSMQSTGQVIKAMISDVKIEGENEMVWSKTVEKAIGRKAAQLYKKRVMKV